MFTRSQSGSHNVRNIFVLNDGDEQVTFFGSAKAGREKNSAFLGDWGATTILPSGASSFEAKQNCLDLRE